VLSSTSASSDIRPPTVAPTRKARKETIGETTGKPLPPAIPSPSRTTLPVMLAVKTCEIAGGVDDPGGEGQHQQGPGQRVPQGGGAHPSQPKAEVIDCLTSQVGGEMIGDVE
jgi:hypothetical protein